MEPDACSIAASHTGWVTYKPGPSVNIHSSSQHLSGCSVLQSQTVISILLIVVILYHFILLGFYM